jgi:hypothetical protein
MKNTRLLYYLKMRLPITVALIVATFLTATAQQQAYVKQKRDSAKRIGLVVKADPFFPIATLMLGNSEQKIYSVTIEKFIEGHFSLQLNGMLLHSGQLPTVNNNNYVLTPQLKYYFSKAKKHEGLFAGAFVKLEQDNQVYSSNIEYDRFYANSYAGGVMAGIQYFVSKRIVIESLIGIGEAKQYNYGFINGQTSSQYTYQGLLPTGILDVNIGYEF